MQFQTMNKFAAHHSLPNAVAKMATLKWGMLFNIQAIDQLSITCY